ncbi:hypothetical protein GGX14DRAFT_403416 [Mycena pura]|uniref:Uncharacterized protein n=1 Tax=Mycena pura TaxID=153505 RepID=A0AAD6Y4H6_9AGAR|nr:hypothetical protein GGX14DRAFT_403416 [Mycena pura]
MRHVSTATSLKIRCTSQSQPLRIASPLMISSICHLQYPRRPQIVKSLNVSSSCFNARVFKPLQRLTVLVRVAFGAVLPCRGGRVGVPGSNQAPSRSSRPTRPLDRWSSQNWQRGRRCSGRGKRVYSGRMRRGGTGRRAGVGRFVEAQGRAESGATGEFGGYSDGAQDVRIRCTVVSAGIPVTVVALVAIPTSYYWVLPECYRAVAWLLLGATSSWRGATTCYTQGDLSTTIPLLPGQLSATQGSRFFLMFRTAHPATRTPNKEKE